MQLNSKKELRLQRIERALKVNLKKRKIFQDKINRGSERRKRPAITKSTARIADKIKIKTLAPFAIFLLLVFVNHESKTKTMIKIIIPKKTKFIY